jgi:hypothetical protein
VRIGLTSKNGFDFFPEEFLFLIKKVKAKNAEDDLQLKDELA